MNITLELAKYIARWRHTEYEYGQHDCMLFPMRWHDTRFGTNLCADIEKKYDSRRSAAVFYKNYLSVETMLIKHGYTEQPNIADLENGDIVQTGSFEWPLLWIAFRGDIYHMSEQGILHAVPSAVEIQKVWRQ